MVVIVTSTLKFVIVVTEQGYLQYKNICSSCEVNNKNRETEQTKLKSLVKANTSLNNPLSVDRFSTNWNKNLATVVNDYHWVFLLVLDENKEVKVFPINNYETKWGESSREQHGSLIAAQKEASWLQNKLKYDSNPILMVHPSCDSYTGFNNLVGEPYVKIDYCASTSEFKPLDIAWVRRLNSYHHAGVYLGNGELIEFTNSSGGITRRRASWNDFLSDFGLVPQEIYRFHPIIPFKHYKDIIANLVWAKDNNYRGGNYNLKNRNCQHFANMAVLGINYSQEIAEKGHLAQNAEGIGRGAAIGAGIAANGLSIGLAPFTGGLSLLFLPATIASTAVIVDDTVNNDDFNQLNNGKGSTIKLTDEVKESNNRLGKKSDFETRELEARIEQVMPSYIPANSCRIM